jgi:ribosome-associated protein
MADDLTIKRGRVIPASAIRVKRARASGPGGQYVNRTESKVQLYFNPDAVSWIDAEVKKRLYALAGQSVDSRGNVLITSQEQRDQQRNLVRAREKLAAMVRRALVRPKRRVATKPSRASKERRLEEKRRRADTKSRRTRVTEQSE